MLKNRIIIVSLFLLLLLLSSFSSSYATKTGTVYLESNQKIIKKGEEIDITVNLKDSKTAAFDFSLYFDESKFEIVSSPENTNVIGNQIIYVWYDPTGGGSAKDGELATFKFRAKEDGLATFTIKGEFYSQEGQLIQTDFKEEQVQIGKEESVFTKQEQREQGIDSQSGNASLQVLRLGVEGIVPVFDSANYEYYLTVSNDIQNIDVLAISENPNATIEITGNNNLKDGLNTINIQVTSKDKTQKNIYTIQVTKTADSELANTNLEILAIENVLLNPPFDVNETNYKVEVSNGTESVNIFAVSENEQATVEIFGKDNLKIGNNLAIVTVTAPNGFTKKKYQVEIYRRNEEEEKIYLEEQQSQAKKVEEAYEIDKVSSNNEIVEETKLENGNIVWVVAIAVIVIAVLVGVLIYIKSKFK